MEFAYQHSTRLCSTHNLNTPHKPTPTNQAPKQYAPSSHNQRSPHSTHSLSSSAFLCVSPCATAVATTGGTPQRAASPLRLKIFHKFRQESKCLQNITSAISRRSIVKRSPRTRLILVIAIAALTMVFQPRQSHCMAD